MYGSRYTREGGDCTLCRSCRFLDRFVASCSLFLFLLLLAPFFLRALALGPDGEADEGRDCAGAFRFCGFETISGRPFTNSSSMLGPF
jgi:hypothetical protein